MQPTGRVYQALVLSACVLVAGCGSQGDDGSAPTTGSAPAAESAPTAESAPQTVATSSQEADAEPALPEGWIVFNGTEVSMAAPGSWVDVRAVLDDPVALEELKKKTPDQFERYTPELLDSVDLYLSDGTVTSGFHEAIVLVDRSGESNDLDALQEAVEAQLNTNGRRLSKSYRSQINGIETLVLDYEADAPEPQIARQYYQIVDDKLIAMAFGGSPGNVDPALWDDMASSVKLDG